MLNSAMTPASKKEINKTQISPKLVAQKPVEVPRPPIRHDVKGGEYYTVNISDPSGRRYLKLGMEVEVNADVSAALQANSPRIRDAIIMLLAGKTFNDISSPDGKVLLKAEVAARLNQILGAQRVIRVYFTDFVVE